MMGLVGRVLGQSHPLPQPCAASQPATQMYQLEVPAGVSPGMQFQADVGGQMMVITCPQGAGPGSTIQVPAAVASPPTVTGVPIGGGRYPGAATGVPYPAGGYPSGPTVVLMEGPPEGFVEVDEISPAGWCCLIAGCFFFPLNLVGLCMRERRLVPASHVYY